MIYHVNRKKPSDKTENNTVAPTMDSNNTNIEPQWLEAQQ